MQLGGHQNQPGEPQCHLGGFQSLLRGPQNQLGEASSKYDGPQSYLRGPQSQLGSLLGGPRGVGTNR